MDNYEEMYENSPVTNRKHLFSYFCNQVFEDVEGHEGKIFFQHYSCTVIKQLQWLNLE